MTRHGEVTLIKRIRRAETLRLTSGTGQLASSPRFGEVQSRSWQPPLKLRIFH
jgi:hypothetical protein